MQYLYRACPSVWPQSNTGSLVDWADDTLECYGSSGMTNCIKEQPGVIGYLDASHASWSSGLPEIRLQNRDGAFLTVTESAARGGIAAAAGSQALPSSAADDFSSVSLINQPGAFTWPMASMTYLYVRQNLSFLSVPQEQALLKAFLQTVYDDSFIYHCVDTYGFIPVEGAARQIALDGIDSLVVDSAATPFLFEESTIVNEGQQDYVISAKRGSGMEVMVDELSSANAELTAHVTKLEEKVMELESLLQHTILQVSQLSENSTISSTIFQGSQLAENGTVSSSSRGPHS